MNRRVFLETAALAGAALYLSSQAIPAAVATPPFELPKLGFDYKALEPYIDAQTMEIHYSKHHKAYVDNLNIALTMTSVAGPWTGWSITELLTRLQELPENLRTKVRNQGGGHYNHTLFWETLTPGGESKPAGDLGKAIDQAFGSYEALRKEFNKGALGVFGSGWQWLCQDSSGKLKLVSTSNQDCPLVGNTPLLGIDVWEHAYYLKYQNRRADYLEAIWNVVNWTQVSKRFRAG